MTPHDLYVADAKYAHQTHRPRVLVRCAKCGHLGIGMIETAGDRVIARRYDTEFDTGWWWGFDELKLLGMPTACPAAGREAGGHAA
jgi:hypothetical protein